MIPLEQRLISGNNKRLNYAGALGSENDVRGGWQPRRCLLQQTYQTISYLSPALFQLLDGRLPPGSAGDGRP